MWPQGFGFGPGAALQMLAMVPGAGRIAMRQMSFGLAVGQAMGRAAQRQMLRATAEALEVVEDLVAEARAERALPPEAPLPVVVSGRSREAARAVAPRAAEMALVHGAGGRLRLRLRGAPSEAEMAALAAALRGFPGVTAVACRPITRSFVVDCAGRAEELAAVLERAGVVRLSPVAFPHPAAVLTALAIARLDALMRARSGGRHSLKSALAQVLEAVEAMQAGQAGGPRG